MKQQAKTRRSSRVSTAKLISAGAILAAALPASATLDGIINVTGANSAEITTNPPNPIVQNPNNGILLAWDEKQNVTLQQNLYVDRVFDPGTSFIGSDANGAVIKATSAQMWTAGEALRRAGDKVSIDLISNNFNWATSVGLYLDADLDESTTGNGLRIYTGDGFDYIRFVGPWGSQVAANSTQIPKGTPYSAHFEVEVTDTDDTHFFLQGTLTSASFDDIVVDFSIEAQQLYFGPATYHNRAGGLATFLSEHDNLMFTPFVPDTGDLNGDGALTNGDISAFVQVLTDPAGYAADHIGLDANTIGDFNSDGLLTNGDIAGFVAALTGASGEPSAIPEPGSLLLLGLSGLMLSRRRRS